MDSNLVEKESNYVNNKNNIDNQKIVNFDEIILLNDETISKVHPEESLKNDNGPTTATLDNPRDNLQAPSSSTMAATTASDRPSSASGTINSKSNLNNNNVNNTTAGNERNVLPLGSKTVSLLLNKINSLFLLVIVPFFIFLCILLRVNFQSIVYLLMLFLMPFMYPINEHTINRNFILILF
jgi:hypothetical protein